ncbi:MAG TPA: AI-2E family transporter [Candidatus Limnocylindrales bacterium]
MRSTIPTRSETEAGGTDPGIVGALAAASTDAEPAIEPSTDPGLPSGAPHYLGGISPRLSTAFFVLGSLFFGLAAANELVAIAAGFSSILLTIFLAWLVAFLMAPLIDATSRRLHIGRGKGITVVYLAVFAIVALGLFATARIGVPEASDILGRSDEITTRIHRLLAGAQKGFGISPSVIDFAATFDQAQRSFFSTATATFQAGIKAIAGTTIAVMGNLFLIVVLSLYAVIDFDGILGGLSRAVPNRYGQELLLVQESVGRAFGGFLRALVILVILQVVLVVVVGLVFGLPYLYLTTVGVALAMFIPFFGPPLALLPPLLAAVVFKPEVALPVVAILVVGQTLLVNVLQPRLMKEAAGIHPILVLIALLLGAQIAGLWGALFGIPIVAVISLLVRYVVNRRVVNEVEGIDLEEVVAEVQAADPDATLDEAVAIAADRAEALVEDRSEAVAGSTTSEDKPRAG